MSVEGTWVSILPFIIVILISLISKEILPGLVVGLIFGSYLVKPEAISGINQLVMYLLNILTEKVNIEIILFLYLFGGLVGMMQIAGGIKGFAEFVRPYINTEKKALLITWLSVPFTIMTPMFRIMIMAPILRAIKEKINISKMRIGYILDISTEPIIVLIPVGTAFVGYMISVVTASLGESELASSGFDIFIKSIPLNFFAIIMIIIGFITSFVITDKENENIQLKEMEKKTNHLHRVGIKKELSMVNAKPLNLFLPIFLLIFLTIVLLWVDGRAKGASTIITAFTAADTTMGMLIAVLLTIFLSSIIYLIRREKLKEIIFHFIDGGNQMMTAIVILILVWAVAMSADDLGFSFFISSTLGGFVPTWLVPVIIFIVGSTIGYFIGTSWGTWGLFMPLGVTLAISTGASIPLTVGAVFASGTFGAFASPLGDTTITTATILEMAPIDYAKYKFKISIFGAMISILLYLIIGFLTSM